MPRIPVRVEPYSSPSHQNRHFKCRRDRILRALCRSCYINKSNFAILLVNAKGDYETYASEAFQGQLKSWFNQKVLNDAKSLALAYQKSTETFRNELIRKTAENKENISFNVENFGEGIVSNALHEESLSDFLSSDSLKSKTADSLYEESLTNNISELDSDLSKSFHFKNHPKKKVLPLASNINNQNCEVKNNLNRPCLSELASLNSSNVRDENCPSVSREHKYKPLVIGNTHEVIAFMESRFKELQQSVCKIVAKAWIKVMEPKKQTRHPYNKGDESKPSWWPNNVRHKEPDHLMKPERINLLLTILRCSKIPVSRLELATAEISAFIPADKTILLREIYQVAREEERLRNGEIDESTKIYTMSTPYDFSLDDDFASEEPIPPTAHSVSSYIPVSTSNAAFSSFQCSLDDTQSTRNSIHKLACKSTQNPKTASNAALKAVSKLHTLFHKEDYCFSPLGFDSVYSTDQISLQNQCSHSYDTYDYRHVDSTQTPADTCPQKDGKNSVSLSPAPLLEKNSGSLHTMHLSPLKPSDRSVYSACSVWSSDLPSCTDFPVSTPDHSLFTKPIDSTDSTDSTDLKYMFYDPFLSPPVDSSTIYMSADSFSLRSSAASEVFPSSFKSAGYSVDSLSFAASAAPKASFPAVDSVRFSEFLNSSQTTVDSE
ncbi:uncharacterized protein T551_02747 [Pneumocystis jirovecii RU7]|uniref:Subtelomeric hrmA-associated cluster protein AFUB-079030/YDR124W-like helical bundle domain-containing protein n=1 Tax=Pneumocystis jirovecii (strain RU7) TaxID=1408657 RepID=A0A0W4ZIX9_PNEJ7|nr:uncharacterized protein T551_02747 [Pneumocystis jirovecii RU7]KTW28328.1 hypothetical protein T551_02747 [Pneumocystis jirovecii RU7]